MSPSTWFLDRNGVVLDEYPGHRRDFLSVARANIAFLRGEIGEAERVERVQARKRTRQIAEKGKDLAGGQTHYRLALRLLEKGRREAAMEQLRAAWGADPPIVEAGVKLGLLLLEMARSIEWSDAPNEASRYYRQGLELMLADRSARRGDRNRAAQ